MTDKLRPQPGPQVDFIGSPATLRVIGGQAGGGKSFGVLLELLRNAHEPRYRAVVFRRTYPELKQPGGIWDDSHKVFLPAGAKPNQTEMTWTFQSGAEIKFSHLQKDNDVHAWHGSRLDTICFEEAQQFSREQILYLLSRLGSASGIRPSVLMTANPDPDSFLAALISWYIHPETGYPIPERSGEIRWFVRDGDDIIWGDTRRELFEQYHKEPLSFTFIPASLDDNPALTEANPHYRSALESLDFVQRERLLKGNWHVRPSAGKVFNRQWFPIRNSKPRLLRRVRFWDCAGTEGSGDWTAGVKLAEVHPDDGGGWIVLDVARDQLSAGKRDSLIKRTAALDGYGTLIRIEQEPGSAGKDRAAAHTQMLAGYQVRCEPATGSKEVRAQALSAQAEKGLVSLLRADWNEAFLNELHGFPEGKYDDQVDGASGAFNALAGAPIVRSGQYQLHATGVRCSTPRMRLMR